MDLNKKKIVIIVIDMRNIIEPDEMMAPNLQKVDSGKVAAGSGPQDATPLTSPLFGEANFFSRYSAERSFELLARESLLRFMNICSRPSLSS